MTVVISGNIPKKPKAEIKPEIKAEPVIETKTSEPKDTEKKSSRRKAQ